MGVEHENGLVILQNFVRMHHSLPQNIGKFFFFFLIFILRLYNFLFTISTNKKKNKIIH